MTRKQLITAVAIAFAFTAALVAGPALAAEDTSWDERSERFESRHETRDESNHYSNSSDSRNDNKSLFAIGGGPGGLVGNGGGQAACKSCSGICQTLVIAGGSDIFWEVDGGSGMSPSECVDAIAAKCGQAYLSIMSSATCQQ